MTTTADLVLDHVRVHGRITILDIETTGLDPFVDRIVEVAVVTVDGPTGAVRSRWSSLVNPGRPITAEATKIHGITDEATAAALPFTDLAEKIDAHVPRGADVVVGAYNQKFDRPFLAAEWVRATGADAPWWLASSCEWVDPLPWIWLFDKYKKGKKLTDACARRGITLKDAHRATADAEAAALLLRHLGSEVGAVDGERHQLPAALGDLLEMQALLAARSEASLRTYWRENPSKSPRARAAAGAP